MYDVQRSGEGTGEVSKSAGADGARTVVLSFDNLGEASELERGTWPAGEPLGRHPSVRQVLPRLLDELDAHSLAATFFVEAINCELYPEALREIAGRGHELGHHGWRHEPWAGLAPGRERSLLQRGQAAFESLGLEVKAFRPPGGGLGEATAGLLGELGYRWCSPAGGPPGANHGLVWVPFDWELVDAYHLMERFGELRATRGEDRNPSPPAQTGRRMTATLAEGDGLQTLILHPFLMLDPAWFAGVRSLLRMIAELRRDGRAEVVPGGRFADALRRAVPE